MLDDGVYTWLAEGKKRGHERACIGSEIPKVCSTMHLYSEVCFVKERTLQVCLGKAAPSIDIMESSVSISVYQALRRAEGRKPVSVG